MPRRGRSRRTAVAMVFDQLGSDEREHAGTHESEQAERTENIISLCTVSCATLPHPPRNPPTRLLGAACPTVPYAAGGGGGGLCGGAAPVGAALSTALPTALAAPLTASRVLAAASRAAPAASPAARWAVFDAE